MITLVLAYLNKPKYIYKGTNKMTSDHIFNFRLAPMHTGVKSSTASTIRTYKSGEKQHV